MEKEKIKVDVLVIGSIAATSYASCGARPGGLACLGNALIDRECWPKEIETVNCIYDISNAVVIRAIDQGVIYIESLVALEGRFVLVTQHCNSMAGQEKGNLIINN